jgi:hypothetical protein
MDVSTVHLMLVLNILWLFTKEVENSMFLQYGDQSYEVHYNNLFLGPVTGNKHLIH